MSNRNQPQSLQYMMDVGVPTDDVAWMARFSGKQMLDIPAENNRAQRIIDLAYEGLCATIKTPGYQLNVQ